MAKKTAATGQDVPEEQPKRGGSYTRNTDGTLTQTHGPDLAKKNADTDSASADQSTIGVNHHGRT